MVHPRVAIASGFTALSAGFLILLGRLDAPVPFAVALLLAARVAAPAAREEAAHSLSRLAASVPAWTGVAVVGVLRAGSMSLADARGANAVAGVALVRGGVLTVASCWIALLAAIIACAACAPDEGLRELDLAALGAQIVFAVTLFAGPQVRRVTDLVPWIVVGAGVGVAVAGAQRFAHRDLAPKAATACAAIAVVLAFAAPKL